MRAVPLWQDTIAVFGLAWFAAAVVGVIGFLTSVLLRSTAASMGTMFAALILGTILPRVAPTWAFQKYLFPTNLPLPDYYSGSPPPIPGMTLAFSVVDARAVGTARRSCRPSSSSCGGTCWPERVLGAPGLARDALPQRLEEQVDVDGLVQHGADAGALDAAAVLVGGDARSARSRGTRVGSSPGARASQAAPSPSGSVMSRTTTSGVSASIAALRLARGRAASETA